MDLKSYCDSVGIELTGWKARLYDLPGLVIHPRIVVPSTQLKPRKPFPIPAPFPSRTAA